MPGSRHLECEVINSDLIGALLLDYFSMQWSLTTFIPDQNYNTGHQLVLTKAALPTKDGAQQGFPRGRRFSMIPSFITWLLTGADHPHFQVNNNFVESKDGRLEMPFTKTVLDNVVTSLYSESVGRWSMRTWI